VSRTFVAAGLLLLGLALGGCGGDPAQPAVASAEDKPSAGPSPTADALTQYIEAQRKWVGCLRQEGYNLPDPDAKGYVDVGSFLVSSKLPKTDPGFLAAQKKCVSMQATVPAELEPSVPPLTPEQLENSRKYSKCMRAHGMPDWPDPLPDGGYPDGFNPTEEHPGDNVKALQICEPVRDGKPPTTYDPNNVPKG
jgi:hypothetical protein